MQSFKNFIAKLKKTKDGRIIVDEPVHFKYQNDITLKDGRIVVSDPVHFKNISNSDLKEELEVLSEATRYGLVKAADFNEKHHGHIGTLSDKLHRRGISEEDKKHIRHYTGDGDDDHTNSFSLNKSLVRGTHPSKMNKTDEKVHEAIMKHATPSEHEFHAFSGTKRNFASMAKSGGTNKFHFPAHTSVTHHVPTAKLFATSKSDNPDKKNHLIHVHVKPGNKILHTSHYSEHPDEHETIIPAGTNMTYHHSSKHIDPDSGRKFHVHHFTIDD